MNGTSQLVGAAGVGLIVANAWTGPQHVKLASVVGGITAGGAGTPADAHEAVKQLGIELLAVGALVLVAEQGDSAAHGALAAITCLWLIWAMRRPWGHTSAPGKAGGAGRAGMN